MGVCCLYESKMLLTIILLKLILIHANAAADAKTTPKAGLVEKLEFRLRDLETKMQDEKENQAREKEELEAKIKELEKRLESKDKEMEARLGELEDKIKEEKLRTEVEDSLIFSNTALAKPSLHNLPTLLISAWQPNVQESPQIVTFESFLANYNNGGGDGVLNLHSGVFTCITPGYYTVSFSAVGFSGLNYGIQRLFLYKNGDFLPESLWFLATNDGASDFIGLTSSRIVILHMDVGETLDLRRLATPSQESLSTLS